MEPQSRDGPQEETEAKKDTKPNHQNPTIASPNDMKITEQSPEVAPANKAVENLTSPPSPSDSFQSNRMPLLRRLRSSTTHSHTLLNKITNLDSSSNSSIEIEREDNPTTQKSPPKATDSHKRVSRSFFSRSSSTHATPADIKKIKINLKECIGSDQKLQIRMYIRAYKEIIKFLCALGTILSFASKDIESKVNRMDELLSSDEGGHYLYLDQMLQYELQKGLVNLQGIELVKTHRGKRFGTRIMYRLHQAMAFLVQFFINVREQPHSKIHTIVSDAYKATISKNHSWLVRKTATVAFYAIPSRNTLIGRMGKDLTETVLMEELQEIIDVATQVYTLAAVVFDRHSQVALHEPKTPTEHKLYSGKKSNSAHS